MPVTITDAVAFLAPFLLLGGLALLGGGFDLGGRHLAGIVAWTAAAALLITDQARGLRFGRRFRLFTALLVALAVLSAVSAIWSSSAHSSLVEADRAIACLGFFLLGYLVCATRRRRRYFVWGLVAALALILILALGSRLFPGSALPSELTIARLSFPLGYWNADGLVFGMATVAFAWASRESKRRIVGLLWVAAIPAAAAGLYLTYSRGGALAGLVTLITIFFLSRDRLWITLAVTVGVVCSLPVIKVIQANPAVADNLGGPGAPAQGREVLAVLLVAMLGAALIFMAVVVVADRLPAAKARVLATSRKPLFLKLSGAVLVGLIGILILVFGGRVWDGYSGDSIYFPENPEAHFTQLSGAGRYQFNQVAIETFADSPLIGTGAGTYRFEWAGRRPIDLVAQDAHSWYLEGFSDLGIPGGLLIIALTAAVIWIGVGAWRRSPPETRGASALMLAFTVTTLVAFGIDWFWELGATAALLMLICGWLVATSESGRAGHRRTDPARWPLIAAAWAAFVLLAVPAVADRYMERSIGATAEGRLADAVKASQEASRLAPYWARPHMQLGVLAQAVGLERTAITEFDRAIELEPDNWQTWYLRSLAESEFGLEAEAESDLDQARSRNPRAPELQAP
ncbi:MAG: O-antigen ligase family protein [Solirubrobacterales bacterium]|nr:O-antigen ligase family protein [Solirubrobacterales bacterium]